MQLLHVKVELSVGQCKHNDSDKQKAVQYNYRGSKKRKEQRTLRRFNFTYKTVQPRNRLVNQNVLGELSLSSVTFSAVTQLVPQESDNFVYVDYCTSADTKTLFDLNSLIKLMIYRPVSNIELFMCQIYKCKLVKSSVQYNLHYLLLKLYWKLRKMHIVTSNVSQEVRNCGFDSRLHGVQI